MLDIPALFLVALVQGITEFLPVSSSGHLVLLPQLTSFADQGQTIDVAAHIGTLGAVMVYVRRDIFNMLASLTSRASRSAPHRHLIGLLVVASLPVIIAGFLLEIAGTDFLRAALIVALANLIFALWLWQADKGAVSYDLTAPDSPQPDWQKMPFKHALTIGFAQIFALIPGASRSGVTMTMARQLGYDRLSAARFSLLLSLPVIAGAGLLKGVSIYKGDISVDIASIAIVAGLSFIFALLAIRWMMGWLAHANFRIFVIYRIVLGIILLGLIANGSL
ncbi:MAG: undecaprenyl-diphosphate phosphatase [Alphaproteobacteria bacterium]|nr:undecaprenyl-diphosphate phosphatase [Alphaproteobacteria bacterium]MBL6777617.1 undecaprenyl-diphosphate phosphatase [Alphaproteobacteria bacterium]